jgi:alpha-L-rhamnosidase
MEIKNLRTSHFITPLGITYSPLSFSWETEDSKGTKQLAAQLQIFLNESCIYDSGKREDISSLGFSPAVTLQPRTRYHWTVTVWSDSGLSASASSWFETAKEEEPWSAFWITSPYHKDRHFLLTRDFEIDAPILSARAYACGLGLYELEVNGKKAGEEYLLPGFHCYDGMIQYQTFDLTDLVKQGQNRIGAMLAPGWYKGSLTFDRMDNAYGDTMQFICELHIICKDGREFVISTDDTWNAHPSPVLSSNIYDGETWDARKEIPFWSAPETQLPSDKVSIYSKDTSLLQARFDPKITVKGIFPPVQLLHTPKGETVLDFGQNMTGWVEFDVSEPEGTEITLSYGELLQDNCFYRDNLRTAKCEYHYISNGTPAHVRPHFTFYGFRYVKVEGIKNLHPENFTACHIRSDIDPIGSITTGNKKVDQLFKNAMWGQFDNFLDIPTDCPQRDERLGWTGDAAIISQTACKNIYMPAFFHHYLKNIALEQKYYHGSVPVYVPMVKVSKGDNIWFEKSGEGTAIWSDVATLLPWALYENYGDVSLLKEHYPIMKTWVEYIRKDDKADGGEGLWKRGLQLGDWLALDTDDPQSPLGATDLTYTASAFYRYSALLVSKAAKALGYEEDAKDYAALAEKIRNTMIQTYFHPDGTFRIEGTQTACVLSLFLQIYPEKGKEAVKNQLRKRIESKNNHLDTGFCGTPFLCRVLSDNGMNDLAYTLFLNEDYPSWLYEVNMGATTVWERWNSVLPDGKISGTEMNSLNHYAYGSIVDWMYRNMCGFQPVEEFPGYKKAIFKPMPDPRIPKAEMQMHTASGIYRSSWKWENDTLHYSFTVPFDCEAEIILPDGRMEKVTAGTYTF